jgi:hypothetical protein
VQSSAPARCANCSAPLSGRYCSACGQEARDLHRPFRQLLADTIEDVFSLDTRLVRTLRPLVLRPGAVTADYLAGRRAPYVPPLRSYLIAALVFFGLFSIFPSRAQVEVFVGEDPVRTTDGSRIAFDLPAHVPVNDEWYQRVSARAKASPEAFSRAVGANVPRLFFLFLPIFAGLLEVFYRRQGYYPDHLAFSLYYHAFVFLVFSALFLLSRTDAWLPSWARTACGWALVAWLVAYLPLALRRVYGGSRVKTFFKLVGLGVLYWAAFAMLGIPLILFAGLLMV